MSELPSDAWANFDPGDFNLMMRRLDQDGWLDGENYVDLEFFQAKLSSKGLDRTLALAVFLSLFKPDILKLPPPARMKGGFEQIKLGMFAVVPEIMQKDITDREIKALIGFVISRFRNMPPGRNSGGDNPK